MSAKDKAIELVDTYRIMLMNSDTECGEEILCTVIAKKAALIAVDEMLEQHKKITVSHIVSAYKTIQDFNENFTNVQNELDSYVLQNYGYWQEVKKEIQLL
jgi:hypothetical protein